MPMALETKEKTALVTHLLAQTQGSQSNQNLPKL